ncbi:hypothetical protein KDL29_07145 [bacterium]|nr:hypothetical protein [bacterium]
MIVAIFIGEYIWRVLVRRDGEAWPGQLQLVAFVVSVLLALQMNDRRYLDELSGSALNWRMFWHILKFLGLASGLFWILFARYRLRLELGRPELD